MDYGAVMCVVAHAHMSHVAQAVRCPAPASDASPCPPGLERVMNKVLGRTNSVFWAQVGVRAKRRWVGGLGSGGVGTSGRAPVGGDCAGGWGGPGWTKGCV